MPDREALPSGRTVEGLAAEIESRLDDRYQLTYVDYRDELTTEQIGWVVRGDEASMDRLWESTDEWRADQESDAARDVVLDLMESVLTQWRDEYEDDPTDYDELEENFRASGECDDLCLRVRERDDSDPVRELARQSGYVLLRLRSPIYEDDMLTEVADPDPADLLSRLGLDASEHNLKAMRSIIDETYPECRAVGYWLASADVGDLYNLSEGKVNITDPGFWLGNPVAGSGWAEQLEGTITVNRSDLITDADAFGYGWQEVAGCASSAFPVTITQSNQEEAQC